MEIMLTWVDYVLMGLISVVTIFIVAVLLKQRRQDKDSYIDEIKL